MWKKNLVLAILISSAGLFMVSNLQARGIADVYMTPHNLGTYGQLPSGSNMYAASNQDRICVFCHTPHGGSLKGPLWNRDLSVQEAAGYTHYSSSTLSSAGANTTRPVNDESLLCLSCHDGSVGVGHMINNGGVVPSNDALLVALPVNGTPGPVIGASMANMAATNDLSDDHPISISYKTSFQQKPTEFNDPSALTSDLHLFGGANYMVECSTCHDPHVDYVTQQTNYSPFLAMPNSNSDMCLACHKK